VPEKRQEVTTEGGLDLVRHERELGPTMKRLHAAGIRVSLFIDPGPEQVDAAARLETDMVELHTGGLANSFTEKVEQQELERLRAAALRASNFGRKSMPGTVSTTAISLRFITSRISLS
jgi:pyridoxine 5-phosphate synthase